LRYPRIIFAYCWFPEPGAVYHFRKEPYKGIKLFENFIEYHLRGEFEGNVEKVFNKLIDERDYKDGLKFFDWLATKYSQGTVLRIIREFEKGKTQKISPSATTIANKYKIWEGAGQSVDNKLIERFREVYEEIKEKAKVKSPGRKK
jgi:hypothetical protein